MPTTSHPDSRPRRNIFRSRWHFAFAFGVFCATLTFACFKRELRAKPVYRVDFSLCALDNADGRGDFAPDSTEDGSAPPWTANAIDRELIVADKMLNDYEKLLNSRRVTGLVDARLREERPDLMQEGIRYWKEITLSRKTHFIDCSFFSESREMALAAATVTNEVFLDTIKSQLGISKLKNIDVPREPEGRAGKRVVIDGRTFTISNLLLKPEKGNSLPILMGCVAFILASAVISGVFALIGKRRGGASAGQDATEKKDGDPGDPA